MENNRTVQRKQNKKKKRPKIRFNFWVMVIIFLLSFAVCFILYMLAANLNDNFFDDELNGDMVASHSVSDASDTSDIHEATTDADIQDKSDSITNPVPQSDAVEESYFDTACLVTDSTLIDMGSNGKFSSDNVFGSDSLNASNCISTKIESSFGTVSVYDIIKNKKPPVLYIMLGSDLESSTVDDMIAGYKMLVDNLHAAMPDMSIYVMQFPPIIYDTETLTNAMINEYNNKLLEMCNESGVYCIDTNTALKSGSGTLAEEYYSYETLGISAVGYDQICQYIRTHVG